MNQTVTYSVWLFLPGVALIWASVSIRRTHRILTQVHQDAGMWPEDDSWRVRDTNVGISRVERADC